MLSRPKRCIMDTTTRQTRKYEKVVEAVKSAIASGELKPGDPMPPERQLISDLGVSRSSLREAFSVLELLGLIEGIPGKGRFVRHPQVFTEKTGQVALEGSAMLELMAARRILDPAIASEAARKASSYDLTKIRRALSHSRETIDNRRQRAQSDYDFHLAIADATHNFMFVNIVRMEFNLIMATHELIYGILEDREAMINEHEAQYDAILSHEASRAAEAAAIHIERIYKTLLGAIALQ